MTTTPDTIDELKDITRRDVNAMDVYSSLSPLQVMSLITEIERLKGELAKQHEIIDKLPRTVDGVAIVPGITVWKNPPERVFPFTQPIDFSIIYCSRVNDSLCEPNLDVVFSTREAAIKGKSE